MATSSSSCCRMAAIAAIVLAVTCYGVSGQSPAPEYATAPAPGGSGCQLTELANMTDCLTYVEDGSNLTKPEKKCCPELAGMIDSNPICLCELLGNPETLGVKIDLNRALKLPSVCGVSTPPVSTCSAVGIPVSLPPSSGNSISPSSGGMPPASGGSANSPSEVASGSEAASPSGNKDNGALGIQASVLPFIFGLATVSVSIFF